MRRSALVTWFSRRKKSGAISISVSGITFVILSQIIKPTTSCPGWFPATICDPKQIPIIGLLERQDLWIDLGTVISFVLTFIILELVSEIEGWVERRSAKPRAWAYLDTPARGRWRFRATETGDVLAEQVPEKSRGAYRLPPDPAAASFASGPDGTVLASVVGQELRFWSVNPSTGTVLAWGQAVSLPPDKFEKPRVLAVAPKGEFGVWLALATVHGIYLYTVDPWNPSNSKNWMASASASRVLGTYAGFLGTRLLLVEDGAVHELVVGKEDLSPWEPQNWRRDGKHVLALDVAKAGGRMFVAVLTDGDRPATELIPATSDQGKSVRFRLRSRATHLAVVRAPSGHIDELCVLTGAGRKIQLGYPLCLPGPKWWQLCQLTRPRRRREEVQVAGCERPS